MTSPYGEPDNPNPNDNGAGAGDQDWPRYESTNHPEDRPGYGYEGYGQQANDAQSNDPYGQYNAGGAGGALPRYDSADGYAGAGNGYESQYGDMEANDATRTVTQPQVFDSIRWGFAATFRNWKLWILGGLLFIVAAGIVGFVLALISTGDFLGSFVTGLLSLLIMPVIYALVLRQMDHQRTGWGHIGSNMNYWPVFLMSLIVQIAMTIIMGIPTMVVALGSNDLQNQQTMTEQELLALMTTMGATFLGVFIVSLLITPFIFSLVWLVADRRTSLGGAFGASFAIGKQNYLKILGMTLLMGVISAALIVLTFGIASIFVAPAAQLATGHFYRQISGGAVPAESRSY